MRYTSLSFFIRVMFVVLASFCGNQVWASSVFKYEKCNFKLDTKLVDFQLWEKSNEGMYVIFNYSDPRLMPTFEIFEAYGCKRIAGGEIAKSSHIETLQKKGYKQMEFTLKTDEGEFLAASDHMRHIAKVTNPKRRRAVLSFRKFSDRERTGYLELTEFLTAQRFGSYTAVGPMKYPQQYDPMVVDKIVSDNTDNFVESIGSMSFSSDENYIYALNNYNTLLADVAVKSELYSLLTSGEVVAAIVDHFKQFEKFDHDSGFYLSEFDRLIAHDDGFKPLRAWLISNGMFLIKPTRRFEAVVAKGEEQKVMWGTAKMNSSELVIPVRITPKQNFINEVKKRNGYKVTLQAKVTVKLKIEANKSSGFVTKALGFFIKLGNALSGGKQQYASKPVEVVLSRANGYASDVTLRSFSGADGSVWGFDQKTEIINESVTVDIIDVEAY